MGYGDIIVWVLAVFLVAVTFLNPAGFIVGFVLALLLMASYYGIPFLGQLIRDRQRGKSAAKVNQGARKRLRGGDND